MRRSALSARLTKLLPLVVGLAVLAGLCWRFGLSELALAIRHLSLASLAAYLFLSLGARIGYGLRWDLVASSLGARIPLWRLLRARLAGDAVGALVPSAKLAGEPVRIAMLYADGIAGAEATAGVTVDRLLELIGNLVCVVAYVLVFVFARTFREAPRMLPLLLALTVASLAALAIPLFMLHRGHRPLAPFYAWRGLPRRLASWAESAREIEDHLLRFFAAHRRAFLLGLAGSLAIELVIVGEYFCLLAAFGVVLPLPLLLLVLLGTGFARAAPTPAGIGVLEAGSVAVLGLAAGQPATGFLIGLVLRLHEALWVAIGMLALSADGRALVAWRRVRVPERV